jgi:hypothetical protein
MHAIEELYFFCDYEVARSVTDEVLKGKLVDEFRKIISDYRDRCVAHLQAARRCTR